MDINGDTPVTTRDEIVISAPIQTIWDIQTDVAGWPSWQPDVDGADADGPLAEGSVFCWQPAGLAIGSRETTAAGCGIARAPRAGDRAR